MAERTGVLLVNLGTPRSYAPGDVYRYLIEFLTDPYVLDFPWWKRQFLTRALIVPLRYRQSAQAYAKIWTPEGSPLWVYGARVRDQLQEKLGNTFSVALGMRYQSPSIPEALHGLMQQNLERLVIIPLFPQQTAATTGSIVHKVNATLKQYPVIPHLHCVTQYPEELKMIEAFCALARSVGAADCDHVLFSFHGLPQRHVLKADRSGCCLKEAGCCQGLHAKNRHCYAAQCHATARAIADGLQLPSARYTLCFQSRLGKEPWMQPYASEVIQDLGRKGCKKIAVLSPSFVCDCLETLFEIEEEYALEFQKAGGKKLILVPGLNAHPLWVEALAELVHRK